MQRGACPDLALYGTWRRDEKIEKNEEVGEIERECVCVRVNESKSESERHTLALIMSLYFHAGNGGNAVGRNGTSFID